MGFVTRDRAEVGGGRDGSRAKAKSDVGRK